jgi:hypothetical protein
MKTVHNTNIFFILFLFSGMFFSSCIKEEFDKPPINIPTVDFESNTTIAQLKSMYNTDLDSIEEDIIIQGIVIANDESGNLYKNMYIRDNTGGIELKIDKTGLYNEYKVGQRVYIKCQGMYMGKYGGMQQLGYVFNNSIGRLPAVLVPNHIFRDSLPGTPPQPAVVTLPGITTDHLGTLIKLENVYFETPGLPFADPNVTTNRNLKDAADNVILVRTSSYADFAPTPTPPGTGSVVGILSIFNGDYQLHIRDVDDLIGFDPNIPVPQMVFSDYFDNAPSSSNWTIYSVASNKDWTYISSEKCMEANGFGGDVASNDWLISRAISLSSGATDPSLAFRTWTRYTDTGTPQPLKVFISTDYSGSGDPSLPSVTWTELPATFPAAHSQAWTSSGLIDLSAYINQTFYIAFQYTSSGTGSNSSSQWRLDNVEVKATMPITK